MTPETFASLLAPKKAETPKPDLGAALKAKQGTIAPTTTAASNISVVPQIIEQEQQSQARQQTMASALLAGQYGAKYREQKQQEALAKDKVDLAKTLGLQKLQVSEQMDTTALQQQEVLAAQQRDIQESLARVNLQNRSSLMLDKLAYDRKLSYDDIFSQARQESKVLAQRKDAADLEQKGFLLALQDKAYQDQIKKIGVLQQLSNTAKMEQEMARLVFGESVQNLLAELGFKTEQNQKNRDLETKLTSISDGAMIDLARMSIQGENTKALYQGISKAVTGSIEAYDKYQTKQEAKAKPETVASNTNSYTNQGRYGSNTKKEGYLA